jgi:hypothetical protein
MRGTGHIGIIPAPGGFVSQFNDRFSDSGAVRGGCHASVFMDK